MNPAQKLTTAVSLALMLVAVTVTSALAQTTNQPRSSADSPRRSPLPIAKGVIEEIDLLRHQVKIKTEDGSKTFTYTTRTYVFRDKERITADSLKVGEVLALRFAPDADGNVVVVRMKVRTPLEVMEPPTFAPLESTNAPVAK
jgi:Cu/Ag efflux protein CusF